MAVAPVGLTTVAPSGAKTAPVKWARPSGSSKGNLLIGIFTVEDLSQVFPSTIGALELIGTAQSDFDTIGLYAGFDGEAANYEVSGWSGSKFVWGRLIAYSGATSPTKAKEAIDAFKITANLTNSKTVTAEGVTPTTTDSQLIWAAGITEVITSFTPPTGMTSIDGSFVNNVEVAEQHLTSKTATGTRTGTVSTATTSVGIQLTIPSAEEPASSKRTTMIL